MTLSHADFETLFRAHSGELLGYLRRRGAGSDAEDLLAEVFLTAWRRRDDLPAPELLRAWLFGVARRLLLSHHRGRSWWPGEAVVPAGGTVGGECDDDHCARAVRRALARLPEEDRELLTMTVWERLTVVQAGQVLGLRPGAARTRLHRIRRRLAADPELAALLEPADAPGLRGVPG